MQAMFQINLRSKFVPAAALLLSVLAVLVVAPSVVLDRYMFPDNDQLHEYDVLTESGGKSLLELDWRQLVNFDEHGKYRPLANIGYMLKYYSIRHVNRYTGVVVNVISMFLVALGLFLLTWEMTKRPGLSLLAPVLYLFTPIVIAQSWLHVVTEDSLVVAFTAFTLYFACRFRQTKLWRWGSATLAMAFFTPYYKEPVIAGITVLCLSEWLNRDRNWKYLVALSIITVNSYSPSWLANLVLFQTLLPPKFTTSFDHGGLGYVTMAQHMLNQVPPLLCLVGMVGLVVTVMRQRETAHLAKDRSRDVLVALGNWCADRCSRSPLCFAGLQRAARIIVGLLFLGGLACLFDNPSDIQSQAAQAEYFQPSLDWYPLRMPAYAFFCTVALLAAATYF